MADEQFNEVGMLSFEIIESGRAIQIYADDDGLLLLRKSLERVTSAGHLHLRSSAIGGNELRGANLSRTASIQAPT